jgi:hypothetical protein
MLCSHTTHNYSHVIHDRQISLTVRFCEPHLLSDTYACSEIRNNFAEALDVLRTKQVQLQ